MKLGRLRRAWRLFSSSVAASAGDISEVIVRQFLNAGRNADVLIRFAFRALGAELHGPRISLLRHLDNLFRDAACFCNSLLSIFYFAQQFSFDVCGNEFAFRSPAWIS